MGQALKLALLLAAVPLAVSAQEPEKKRAVVGCAATAKTCTCYSRSGRPVEMDKAQCLAKFAPTTFMKFEQGDITSLVTPVRVKPPAPENEPYRKLPVPWLIER